LKPRQQFGKTLYLRTEIHIHICVRTCYGWRE